MVLTEKDPNLTQRQIDELFEILGLENEEKRKNILNQLSLFSGSKKGYIRIKVDNVTAPYHDMNA